MARYGVDFPEADFYAMAGMPSDKVIRTLADRQGVEVDVEKAMDEKEDLFLENLHQLRPLDYTVSLAREYSGKKPLAVASGGTLPIVRAQLEHLGIFGLFDAIVTAEHTEKHKPEPEVFLEAARQLGVKAENCLVFEDGDLGIEAAKRAGMEFVDVREIGNN